MQEIIQLIRSWMEQKKCGKIIVNFFMGGITSYECRETKKPESK